MTKTARSWWLVALLLGACLVLALLGGDSQAEEPLPSLLTGLIEDSQGVAVREFAIETRADILVMGRPMRSPGSNTFKPAEFDAYVTELERDTNLHVIVVRPPQARVSED